MSNQFRFRAGLLSLVVASAGLLHFSHVDAAQTVASARSALSNDGVSLVFAGDALFGRSFSEIKDPDLQGLFKIFQDADASFLNLEQVMSPVGTADPDYGQLVRNDPGLLRDLKWAGIDAVALANNHSLNYGTDGLMGTIKELDAIGIKHAGAGRNVDESIAPAIVDAHGLKVGLLSLYSGTTGGNSIEEVGAGSQRPGMFLLRAGEVNLGGAQVVAPLASDLAAMAKAIEAARPKVDILAVSIHMHWGNNTFKEEFAEYQPMVARAAIDAGADLFVIHGPHVPRGVEAYKNGFIAYSVGNLFWNLKDIKGIKPNPVYELDEAYQSIVVRAVVKDKRVQRVEVIPIYLFRTGEYQGIPKLADAAKGQQILDRTRRLSAVTRTKLAIKDWYGVVQSGGQ